MKKFLLLLSLITFISIIILFQSCKEDSPSESQNQAPQIQSLVGNPNTSTSNRLPAGGTITFTVTATDPDKDPLAYTWECSGGSFTQGQNTNLVVWQSPVNQSTASYVITVNVSDGALIKSSSKTAYVAAAQAGINTIPTNLDFGFDSDTLSIKIFNNGTGSLSWQIQNLVTWISASPSSGTLSQPSDTALSKIIVDRGTLTPGNYNQTFNAVNTNNPSNKVAVNVSMVVSAYGYVEGHTYYAGTTIPVSGVSVNIDNTYYTTGSDGYYRLNDVTLGNKILKATKEGYDQFQSNINVIQGKNTKEIELTSALYTHKVYGIIKSNKTSAPINNVKVEILNPDGNASQLQTVSDINGYYQIPTVPQGSRKIRFTHIQHDTFEAEIFLSNTDYLFDVGLNVTVFELSGNYSKDWTFYLYNSPYYIVGNTSFLNGYTLNIEPGAIILFKGNYTLSGNIIAEGSQQYPIYFTSFDTLTPVRWNTLELKFNSILNYVIQSYATTGVTLTSSGGSTLTVKNSTLQKNLTGVLIQSQYNELISCLIQDNQNGVEFNNANGSRIINSIIQNNSNNGINVNLSDHIYIRGTKILSNSENGIFNINSIIDSISYSEISHNGKGIRMTYYGINTTGYVMKLSHCTFNFNYNGTYHPDYDGHIPPKLVEYCDFNGSTFFGTVTNNVPTSLYNSWIIKYCNFFNYSFGLSNVSNPRREYSIQVHNCNFPYGAVIGCGGVGDPIPTSATNNWWGNNPPLNQEDFCSTVTFSPWLSAPEPDAGP